MAKRQAADALKPGSTKKLRAETNATLYVKNLNDQIAIEDLRASLYILFSMVGHVIAINAHKSLKMRGQAHIAFANSESAAAALAQFTGKQFLGKPMQIEYAKHEALRRKWLQRDIQTTTSQI